MDSIKILGVKISSLTKEFALDRVGSLLRQEKQFFIVTPNPEFLVRAQSDVEFRDILNRADLALPDGVGLRCAAKILSSSDVLSQTIAGSDFLVDLCRLAAGNGLAVFFLGGRDGVGAKSAQILKRKFPSLKVIGTYEGQSSPDRDEETRSGIRSFLRGVSNRIDLLFVAYGAPAQEKWIARNLAKLPVKGAIGVGGAFDFIAGKRKRAPQLWRRLGFEWLWRLLLEPARLPRVFNAVIRFPFLVFLYKLKHR